MFCARQSRRARLSDMLDDSTRPEFKTMWDCTDCKSIMSVLESVGNEHRADGGPK